MLMRLAATRGEGRRGLLITDINGASASVHPMARLFIEEGFAATALGLQARVGTRIAAPGRGGTSMAEPREDQNTTTRETGRPLPTESSDQERDRIRSSNDLDQQLEREGETSRHNRGYDEAVGGGGQNAPTDPDSADSDIDRDDTVRD
jgi:hypothetical protein